MSKHVMLPALVVALAVAGCTGSMNASVTPGVPGASASPAASTAPGASTAPTVSASASVAVGASTTPASAAPVAAGVDPAMAALYTVGRMWTYENVTTSTPGGSTTSSFTREVLKVEGTKATVKQVTTVAGKTTESTEEVDLTKKANDIESITTDDNGKTIYTWTQSSAGDESITVKAGTYAAHKYVGKLTATAENKSMAAGTVQDATFWIADDVGLLKNEVKGSMTTAGFTVSFNTVIELTAFKK